MEPKITKPRYILWVVAVVLAAALIAVAFVVAEFPNINVTEHNLATGNWQAQYSGVAGAGTFVQTVDNGFALSGTSTDGAILLIRTNASRDEMWRQTYGSGFGNAVISTAQGGFAVAGAKFSGSGAQAKNVSFLIVTDSSGNVQWSKEYDGSGFASLVNASDGGYVMLGRFNASGLELPGLVKVDAAGNVQWTKTYTSSEADVLKLTTLIGTADGGYAMVGEMQYTNGGMVNRNGWFVKTAANGDALVNRPFAFAGWTVFNSVAQAQDGGYMLVGATANSTDGPYGGCLVRTDSGGHSLWSQVNLTLTDSLNYTFGDGTGFVYYSIASVSNGNYDVTGYINGGGILAEVLKDDGSWLELHAASSPYQSTYVIPVAQGVYAPGYAYIGVDNGTLWLTEEYSYIPS